MSKKIMLLAVLCAFVNLLNGQTYSLDVDAKRIRIREKTGRLLSDQKYGTGVTKAVVNIQNLKPDVYILQVFDGKVWYALELLVK